MALRELLDIYRRLERKREYVETYADLLNAERQTLSDPARIERTLELARLYDLDRIPPSNAEHAPGRAPGKRTLTQGLPPRSLRGQERDVTTFDVAGEYRESRATIDRPHRGPLTDAQLAQARRRNPRWQRQLGFDPRRFSLAALDSEAFAEDVARAQAKAGLSVDGIVGPRTAARLAPRAMPADPGGGYREDRATIAGPPAAALDDPFALHRQGG